MPSILEQLRHALYPCQVTKNSFYYVITGGTIGDPFSYKVTPTLISSVGNVENLIEILKKKLNYILESHIIEKRYNAVLNDTHKVRTPDDYIIMVDSQIPPNNNILVVNPQTYNDFLRSGKAIHAIEGYSKHNWKQRYDKNEN